jgi:hypothetical protein
MLFYTTREQEIRFRADYLTAIQEKQDEIDVRQKRTRVLEKYTAYALVHMPNRVFVVRNGAIYLRYNGIEEPVPLEPCSGGSTYKTDKTYTADIDAFTRAHPAYTITFYVTTKYGPTIEYASADGSYASILEAPNGERCIADNETAYSIVCL